MTRVRLGLVGLVVAGLFAAMFARLWYLQVLTSPKFSQLAVQNQVRQVFQPAPRGLILDRQGQAVVANQTSEVVTLSRQGVSAAVEARLAKVLGMSTAAIKAQLANTQYSPYRPVPIMSGVPATTVIYLREHQASFPGVSAQLVAQRSYPYKGTAAQMLGYTGAISSSELASLRAKGYQAGDQVGQSGAEASFEPWLHGQPGMEKLAVDASGRVVGTLDRRLPVPGDNVQLNVDLGLQQTLDRDLAKEIHSLQGTYSSGAGYVHPPSGAAVVLDPRSGAVLAMSSFPTYDPSVWVGGISNSEFAALNGPSSHDPLLNRAVQGLYTPGSTFKLATATAAVNTGLITPSYVYDDTGSFPIPNCTEGLCNPHNAGYEALGPIALTEAIGRSDDVYFYNLGYMFYTRSGQYGAAPIQDAAHAYGMGQPTGVDLPGEYAGIIDSQAERAKLHAADPKAYPNTGWTPGDQVEMAFGQGGTVITPLQLAEAYATFANGGTRYQPQVAADVVDAAGKVVKRFSPVVTGRVPMSSADHQALLDGFIWAVRGPGGTATSTFQGFDFSKLQVAGKTGTATVSNNLPPDALFVAFAGKDINQPQYVVAVVISQAGYGATGAAPVARKVLQYLSNHPVGPVIPPPPVRASTNVLGPAPTVPPVRLPAKGRHAGSGPAGTGSGGTGPGTTTGAAPASGSPITPVSSTGPLGHPGTTGPTTSAVPTGKVTTSTTGKVTTSTTGKVTTSTTGTAATARANVAPTTGARTAGTKSPTATTVSTGRSATSTTSVTAASRAPP